ncbi:MAG: AAA family ATPase [Candidatus Aenigmatarchaeota archaeon]
MYIVGITGPMGSGKDTVSEYLDDVYDFRELSYGDIVRDIADEEGVEPTRENLQKISKRYRESYGMEYFAQRMVEKMDELGRKKYVLSGIRRIEDFKPIKKRYGENFKLLLIDAKPKIRFKRLKKRGLGRDPDSFEKFKEQDETEFERYDMEETFKEADYTIHNNGSLDELKKKVDAFVNDFGLS